MKFGTCLNKGDESKFRVEVDPNLVVGTFFYKLLSVLLEVLAEILTCRLVHLFLAVAGA